MHFAILFEDNDALAHKRAELMPEHLAFLERNKAVVHAAGPLNDNEFNRPAGGLWLVELEDQAAVQALIEEDPFWPTGMRKSVRILQWNRVFADGQKLI